MPPTIEFECSRQGDDGGGIRFGDGRVEFFECCVEIGDVGLMMFGVMDGHCFG
jgi:hypothetical protein